MSILQKKKETNYLVSVGVSGGPSMFMVWAIIDTLRPSI